MRKGTIRSGQKHPDGTDRVAFRLTAVPEHSGADMRQLHRAEAPAFRRGVALLRRRYGGLILFWRNGQNVQCRASMFGCSIRYTMTIAWFYNNVNIYKHIDCKSAMMRSTDTSDRLRTIVLRGYMCLL